MRNKAYASNGSYWLRIWIFAVANQLYFNSFESGDSGGPLVLKSDNRTLIGVTSFGHASGCDSGIPQAFTRVTSFLQWIGDNTGIAVN